VRLLDELGFSWKMRERGTWDDSLNEIAAFKAKNAHCEIPLNYPENPKLGRFVSNTRAQRNRGELAPDRIAKLDALGFIWKSGRTVQVAGEGINAAWKARFDELLWYKAKHGDCKVPTEWPDNPHLAHWVVRQRQLRKSGQLNPKREELLNTIGSQKGQCCRSYTIRLR
jgi:hypothetical protein